MGRKVLQSFKVFFIKQLCLHFGVSSLCDPKALCRILFLTDWSRLSKLSSWPSPKSLNFSLLDGGLSGFWDIFSWFFSEKEKKMKKGTNKHSLTGLSGEISPGVLLIKKKLRMKEFSWGITWCHSHNGRGPGLDDSLPILHKTKCFQYNYHLLNLHSHKFSKVWNCSLAIMHTDEKVIFFLSSAYEITEKILLETRFTKRLCQVFFQYKMINLPDCNIPLDYGLPQLLITWKFSLWAIQKH